RITARLRREHVVEALTERRKLPLGVDHEMLHAAEGLLEELSNRAGLSAAAVRLYEHARGDEPVEINAMAGASFRVRENRDAHEAFLGCARVSPSAIRRTVELEQPKRPAIARCDSPRAQRRRIASHCASVSHAFGLSRPNFGGPNRARPFRHMSWMFAKAVAGDRCSGLLHRRTSQKCMTCRPLGISPTKSW